MRNLILNFKPSIEEGLRTNSYNSVLLLSGGLDSAVAASLLSMDESKKPLCVFVDQGFSMHNVAVKLLANYMKLDVIVFDMRHTYESLQELNTVIGSEERHVYGYRLFTWMLGLSVATKFNIPIMSTGEYCHTTDPENPEMEGFSSYLAGDNNRDMYEDLAIIEAKPDSRRDFANMFATIQTMSNPIQVNDPLYNLTKSGVIKLGHRLGTPVELTSSCRNKSFAKEFVWNPSHNVLNCGACTFCKSRMLAFVEADIVDHTVYDTDYSSVDA